MHLLLVNQYYPPDEAPTGLMLEAVAEQLADLGHEVTVLCSAGGYAGNQKLKTAPTRGARFPHEVRRGAAETAGMDPVNRGRIRVVRVGATSFGRGSFVGKLADYGSFYLGVVWKLLTIGPKPDRMVALTTPPYLAVVARVLSKLRGGDHAHWVMDLYPDVMVAHGMLAERGLGHRVLGGLTRFGFGGKRCAAVLTLGPDMAERVAPYLPENRQSEWVPLWGTGEEKLKAGIPKAEIGEGGDLEGGKLRQERGWGDDELILMYSGNMGLGHRFGEIFALIEAGSSSTISHPPSPISRKKRSVRFVFYGGGKRRVEVERFLEEHPEAPVELHDYVPRAQLGAHLRSADLHLASLEPSWDGTMVPSKLQGIFAAARPVLFVGSENSSIGRWILESGGGWVVPPGDDEALRKAIGEAGDPVERLKRGERARVFAVEHFDASRNAAAVAKLLAG